ncbi:neprilysin-1-like [Ornithodoros turicata]|uniref:neprilysin-1-like n=1 Tax=Ornithodoros turicata TaxID=34597 RepID=UPI00313A4A1A
METPMSLVPGKSSHRILGRTITEASKVTRQALIVVAIFSLCIIVIVAYVLGRNPGTRYSVCHSAACLDYSLLLRSAVDRAVDPCNNFYQFVCGTWDRNHEKSVLYEHRIAHINEIEAEALEYSAKKQNQTANEKAAKFYQSCMDIALRRQNGVPALKDMLKKGNITWPTVQEHTDLLRVMAYANIHWDCIPLLDISKYTLPDGTTGIRLLRSPFPSLWNDTRNEILQWGQYQTAVQVAHTVMTGVNSTVQFFTSFKIHEDRILTGLGNTLENSTRVAWNEDEFNQSTRAFSYQRWRDVFEEYFNIPQHQEMVVDLDSGYLRALDELMLELGEKALTSFFGWGILQQLGHLFHPDLASLVYGRRADADSTSGYRCLILVETYMGMAVTSLYTFKHIPESRYKAANAVLERIKARLNATFESPMKSNSSFTKTVFMESVNPFEPFVSSNVESLNIVYRSLPDFGDTLATNLEQAIAAWRLRRTHGVPQGDVYLDDLRYFELYKVDKKALIIRPPMVVQFVFADLASTGLQYGGLGSFVSRSYLQALHATAEDRHHIINERECLDKLAPYRGVKENEEQIYYDVLSLPLTWSAFISARSGKEERLSNLLEFSEYQLFFLIYCHLRCTGAEQKDPAVCNFPLLAFPMFSTTFHCTGLSDYTCYR